MYKLYIDGDDDGGGGERTNLYYDSLYFVKPGVIHVVIVVAYYNYLNYILIVGCLFDLNVTRYWSLISNNNSNLTHQQIIENQKETSPLMSVSRVWANKIRHVKKSKRIYSRMLVYLPISIFQ